MKKPSVVSLFAGCGGSSAGYKMAGCSVKMAVEWEEIPVASYRRNFPRAKVHHGDVCDVTGDLVMEQTGLKKGELDLLDASPPCQGFSTSGLRHLHDPRNQLFLEFVRLLEDLQPRSMVMENVAGLTKGKMKAVLAEMLAEMDRVGYNTKTAVLKASWYGVPQARDRLIVTGTRKDLDCLPVLPKPRTAPVSARAALRGVDNKTFHSGLSPSLLAIWQLLEANNKSPDDPRLGGRWFNFRRLDPDQPAPTLIASRPATTHWDQPRLLTIEEAKRLQSFPDNFELVGTYGQQWKQIGNSVPPLLTKAIAEDLLKVLPR